MTDRVLTEEEVIGIDNAAAIVMGSGFGLDDVMALLASHRLQAARIQELEKLIRKVATREARRARD